MNNPSTSKIGVWSLLILIATLFIVPIVLPLLFPSLLFGESSVPVVSIIIGLVALILGFLLGTKISPQKERMKNALGVGLFTLLFAYLFVVSSSRPFLEFLVLYGLILVVPLVGGALVGGALKKK